MHKLKNALKWLIIALIFYKTLEAVFSVIYFLIAFPFFPPETLPIPIGIFTTATITLASLWAQQRFYPSKAIAWDIDRLFKVSLFLLGSLLFAYLLSAILMVVVGMLLADRVYLGILLSWLLAGSTIAFFFLWVREIFFRKV